MFRGIAGVPRKARSLGRHIANGPGDSLGKMFKGTAEESDYANVRNLAVGVGALGIGANAAVSVGDALISPLAQNAKVEYSRRMMLSKTPSLRQEDSKMVKDYFNVVKQFSPKAAANPLVAGALVNKMIQFGGVDHKLVQDLAKIQKDTMKNSDRSMSSMGIAESALIKGMD